MRWMAEGEGHVEALAVVSDGAALVVAAAGGEVARWPLGDGDVVGFGLPDEEPLRLAVAGGALYVGMDSGRIYRASLGDGGEGFGDGLAPFGEALDGEVGALAATPDGALIAVAGGEDFVVELRGSDGAVRFSMNAYKWPYVVRFSHDAARLAVGSWDGELHLVDVVGLREERLGRRLPPWLPIFDVAFAADGSIFVAAAEGIARVTLDGAEPSAAVETGGEVFAIALSPDGSLVAAGGNEQALVLYAADSLGEVGRIALDGGEGGGRPIPTYADFTTTTGPGAVRAIAFHPDGERIFVGTDGGRVAEVTVRELVAEAARVAAERAGAALKAAMPELARELSALDEDARALAEEALPEILEVAQRLVEQMGKKAPAKRRAAPKKKLSSKKKAPPKKRAAASKPKKRAASKPKKRAASKPKKKAAKRRR